MTPLVSVIIPTANRPHFLPRAVASALAGMPLGAVEVIVVPNGPDKSWKQSLLPYQKHPSVRVIPISEANANIARNTGLTNARGEFVRFLDDDDYLIPEGAVKQYELIQLSGVDVVSGSVQLVDVKGRVFDVGQQPDMDDLCVAVLGPWRRCQTMVHVYRRSKLGGAKWNPQTSVRQDFEWLFDLCSEAELSWKKTNDVVGAWQHHWAQRISSSGKFNDIRKVTVPMLLRAYNRLLAEGRLDEARKRAVLQGIWGCVHAAFFLEPFYWTRVAQIAIKIDSRVRPIQQIYTLPVIRILNPLLVQWIMLPKRWMFHKIRQLLKVLQIRHNW
ncbi:MAG: glycosyltransferase family 2 protein [Bacteroidetes bacterium]|nr:glycosyltransferase family 2 protein [Bacteroidota bacterium]